MPTKPIVSYFLYSGARAIQEGDRGWHDPLPLDRTQLLQPADSLRSNPFRRQDYFLSARAFLARNDFGVLTRAVGLRLGRKVLPEELEEINIRLMKHGAFYHPARVDVRIQKRRLSFVLNLAIGAGGRKCMQDEYALLRRLHRDFPDSYIPSVYGRGTASLKKGDYNTSLFLGEWFDGFCEFHLSVDPHDRRCKILLWDDDEKGESYLTTMQTECLYRKIAGILTYYYNLQTFEQISSWHHAAGDFVVKMNGQTIAARLVTVRQYGPMFKIQAPEAALMLHALLIFFLNLSIRIRLDRLDGVGKIVWSDDAAVSGTVKGFMEALRAKERSNGGGAPISTGFKTYLGSLSEKDLLDLLENIVDRYAAGWPDLPVIRKHLKDHAGTMKAALADKWI